MKKITFAALTLGSLLFAACGNEAPVNITGVRFFTPESALELKADGEYHELYVTSAYQFIAQRPVAAVTAEEAQAYAYTGAGGEAFLKRNETLRAATDDQGFLSEEYVLRVAMVDGDHGLYYMQVLAPSHGPGGHNGAGLDFGSTFAMTETQVVDFAGAKALREIKLAAQQQHAKPLRQPVSLSAVGEYHSWVGELGSLHEGLTVHALGYDPQARIFILQLAGDGHNSAGIDGGTVFSLPQAELEKFAGKPAVDKILAEEL